MKIDKAKLQKLQGLIPCTSSITFTPSVYDGIKDDEDLKDCIPTFTCLALTEGQVEKIKKFGADRYKHATDNEFFPNKKESMLSAIGENITGWDNLYDMVSGDKIKFSADLIENLPENVVESILMDLSRYAGIVPR
jgi:hypothetical protein